MSNLKKTQQLFQAFLLNSNKVGISSEIVNHEKVSADVRLSVYGEAYRSRLVDALAVNFPYLQAFLGCNDFVELAHAYIQSRPSKYRSIRWYGDAMPEFLCHDEKYKDAEYLVEIAELDWTMTKVFDAQDATVYTIEEMAVIAPESWADMRFTFHPSVYRKDFNWNVVECWRASRNNEVIDVAKYPAHVSWVFWRDNYLNKFGSLTIEERCALDAALTGANFSEICEELLQCYPEDAVALQAASMLKSWIGAGLVSKVII